MTDEEFVSMMQSTLGRIRCDLTVAAIALKDVKLGPPWPDANRLLVAAELIEKTQAELSTITTRLTNEKAERTRAENVPPLPVPGPGRQS